MLLRCRDLCWRPKIPPIESWIKRFEITYTVLCGDAMWPRMRDWKNLARWQRLASEKYKNFVFFNVWGQKMNASTTVNSWKRLQSHANTNRNASHVKMRMSQNPGRVAKLQTEMLEKRSNCAGSLRAAWPSFWMMIWNGSPKSSKSETTMT